VHSLVYLVIEAPEGSRAAISAIAFLNLNDGVVGIKNASLDGLLHSAPSCAP